LSSLSNSWPVRPTVLLVDDDPFLANSRKFVLERRFSSVERVADAAQAFIRLDDPSFAARLSLAIVALGQPGLAGPAFVNELSNRAPGLPILVLGRAGEIAPDYRGEHVRFLPRHATPDDVLAGACEMLSLPRAKVA
jgi:CheY-like chemotaxis protein